MSQKKLLILGGTDYQIVAIRYAQRQGHHVITCDYLPGNLGHRIADEYHNVSTTDMPGVLALAGELKIDGILAFASDPAAPTAAFVAEKLGLPGNPFDSVMTLTSKHLFRQFLHDNGFHSPRFASAQTLAEAQAEYASLLAFGLPVLIKPVDSSGSKGVRILRSADELPAAFETAMEFSRAKRIILEQYVAADRYQVAGDGFVVDGRLAFRCFGNEHFKPGHPTLPVGESFPSVQMEQTQDRVHAEVQRLLDLLGMRNGALNFDIRVDPAGQVWLMEIGPRAGGMLLPEVIEKATGVDMTARAVDAALGIPSPSLTIQPVRKLMSSFGLNSLQTGTFKEVSLSPQARRCMLENRLFIKPGARIAGFHGSHGILGVCTLVHDSMGEMLQFMDDVDRHIQVIVE